MPLYHYRAINERGRTIKGGLTAVDERDLAQRLGQSGLELIEAGAAKTGRSFLPQGPVPERDLAQLTLHLSEMQRAGIPVLEGLEDIRDTIENPRLRDATAEIHRDVGEGKSLSAAFARQNSIFGPLFPSLIRAGEETGNLAEALTRLRQHVEWQAALKSRIKKATAYPIFLFFMAMAVVIFMMVGVVPQVVDFLRLTNDKLPPMTEAIIFISNIVTASWWIVLLLGLAGFFAIRLLVRVSDTAAYEMDRLALAIPFIGNMLQKLALARFAHFLSILFKSGLDLLQAMHGARDTLNNRALAEAVRTAEEGVRNGQSLSNAMRQTGAFPALVLRLVKVGEDTGSLTHTLEQVASYYDREADEAINTVIGTLEPALTLIVGAIMISIVLAVISPIYENLSTLMAQG